MKRSNLEKCLEEKLIYGCMCILVCINMSSMIDQFKAGYIWLGFISMFAVCFWIYFWYRYYKKFKKSKKDGND